VVDTAQPAVGDPSLERWNQALGEELLAGQSAGIPFYLFLEPPQLKRVMAAAGGTEDGARALAEAVSSSLIWREGTSPFARHLQAMMRWEDDGKIGYPPYLALLAVLSLAAESMVTDAQYASHNYHARLVPLLGLDSYRAERLRRHFPETVRFWHSLNDWLEDWEGDLGLPTARVHDRRVYVGFALSQALVREQDRHSLHAAFERYGLSPRRKIRAAEMAEYLSDWLSRPGAPANLVRLWRDDAARRRITEVACEELEHWAGTILQAGQRGSAREAVGHLEWLAELVLEPLPEIFLYLVSRLSPESVEGRYEIGGRTDEAGHAAVSACLDALELKRLPGLGFASLEPWDRVGATSALAGSIELQRCGDAGVRLMRSPSPLLVLAFDDRDSRYHEVPRAQLLERCLVLAQDVIAPSVERHLRAHARAGFRQLGPANLRQLPRGWHAFVDVILVEPAEDEPNGIIDALCAAPATGIALGAGLRIGQSTWHAARPPETLASVSNGAPFRLLLRQRRQADAGNSDSVLGSFIGKAAADLSGCGLQTGEYEVRLEQMRSGQARTVQAAGFRLRSAGQPRPIGARREVGLAYDLY
jgi:hypothetical protein